jgi:hypothetical protein
MPAPEAQARRAPFHEPVDPRVTGSTIHHYPLHCASKEADMRFLSIYKAKETGVPPTPDEMARMGRLIEEGMKAGYLVAVEGCLPSARGARVRLSNGSVQVTDGPFTESKEVVGGLAIIQAESKEDAIQHVKTFLNVAGDGECELRQLFEAPVVEAAASA